MRKQKVNRRANGTFYDTYRDHTGERRWVYGKTQGELETKLKRALKAVEQHHAVTPARLTVSQYLTKWLEITAKPRLREGTFTDYESIIRVHLLPTLGKKRILSLTPTDVKNLLADKLASGLSPRRVQLIHAVLRCAFNDGVADGVLDYNPALIRRAVRVEKPEKPKVSVEDVRAILQACEGTRLYPLVYTAVVTSLRQAELIGLQWSDLNLDEASMRIHHQYQRGALVPLKTHSERTQSLSRDLVKVLRNHRLSQDPISPFVFASERGTPLDGVNVTHRLKSSQRSHGLPATSFHFLRGAAATLRLRAGASVRDVQDLLGHSRPGMTMEYAAALPDAQRESAERVSEMLASG